MRTLRALFVLYVVVTSIHIAYVVSREPFAFDAWNVAVDSGAQPATLGKFLEFWWGQYTSSNPRIGQPLAYLAYKIVGFAELGTVLAYFAIVGATFVIGAGRLPQWRRSCDLAALSIAIGVLWFAAPEMPSFMFCRAYATNYVWAAAIQLWFVAAIRLYLKREDPEVQPRRLVAYLLFGILAGASNEHTGPTLVLFSLLCIWWGHRRDHRWHKALLFSASGVIVGFGLLFFAPGQGQRYDGLAQRLSLKDRLLARGVTKNLDIFDDLLYSAGPLLMLLLAAVVIGEVLERRKRTEEISDERTAARIESLQVVGGALLAGVTITITVFVSPKLGTRFYMHSMLLLLAGFLSVLLAFLRDPRSYRVFIIIAVAASLYAIGRTVPMYTRLHRDSEQRLRELAATPIGGVYTADGWEEIPGSWWFLGDDFRDQKKRELVAKYFALSNVVFRGQTQWAALGVSDVRLYSTYEFDREICIDEQPDFEIEPYIGRDINAVHTAFKENIARVLQSDAAQLRRMDLRIKFLGQRPPMPSSTLLVAKWQGGNFEHYAAKIKREGRNTMREVVPGPEMAGSSWKVYLASIGHEPRLLGAYPGDGKLTYVPWRSGSYWVIACRGDECWVVASTFHRV